MGNAYGSNSFISIRNTIPPGDRYYSKKGYKIEPVGHGSCMYGVYDSASWTATYNGRCGHIGIHYASAGKGGCAFKSSSQDFNVINEDTGHVVGRFRWKKPLLDAPHIDMLTNPDYFMLDVSEEDYQSDVLNLKCQRYIDGNVQ